jgi:3-oxoacyl-[acyl-carrier protein] reductase
VGLGGQVAVITGGASGIGAAIARRFAADGARVVLGDVNGAALEAMAAELGDRCRTHLTDVTVEADVAGLCDVAVSEFGQLDVAVNSAGRGDYGLIVDTDAERWRSLIDLCLTGVMLSIKHEARQMIELGTPGSIINIASLNAVQPSAGMAAYCAAKAGVAMLTQVAAMELGPHGIRVNAIAPGLIDTPATALFHAIDPIREEFRTNTALGRTGTAAEVAGVAAFLAGPDSALITAETILVDGGGRTGRYPQLPRLLGALES